MPSSVRFPLLALAVGAIPASAAVTFTKDVAPILQAHCQVCHRPDNIAPMSLLTYQDARPWAKSIKQQVVQRNMPPWFIDPHVGIRKFKDDPSLSERDIATISAWVDAGAPMGNLADMPPPRQFEDADKWHIGKPDLIVSMPVAYTVKPAASDWWGNFIADSGLTEDRYIKAVETKPTRDGIKIVHHAVTSLVYDDGQPGGGTLNEYAVGKNGDIYPDGSGKLMKAGVAHPLQHALPCDRPADHGSHSGRVRLLSQGLTSPSTSSAPCSRPTTTISTFLRAPTTCAPTPTSSSTSRRVSPAISRTCTIAAKRSAWKRSIRT